MPIRNENIITYTPDEQEAFNLPPCADADMAVFNADILRQAAINLTERIALDAGNATREAQASILRRQMRASELSRFAGEVFRLCPDEHLQLILDKSQVETQQ